MLLRPYWGHPGHLSLGLGRCTNEETESRKRRRWPEVNSCLSTVCIPSCLYRGPRRWAKLRLGRRKDTPWEFIELLRRVWGQGQNETNFHGNPNWVASQTQGFTEKLQQKEKHQVLTFMSPKAWNSWFQNGSFCLWKQTRKRCRSLAFPTLKKKKKIEKREENHLGDSQQKGLPSPFIDNFERVAVRHWLMTRDLWILHEAAGAGPGPAGTPLPVRGHSLHSMLY